MTEIVLAKAAGGALIPVDQQGIDFIEGAHGIYSIWNRLTDKQYIGSAVNLKNRKRQHLNDLRRGRHKNAKLQASWRRYGEGAFEFRVLELVTDRKLLIPREQSWLDTLFATGKQLNLSPIANSRLGMKHSDASKKKMSVSKSGSLMGPRSDETRAKISLALKGKEQSPEHVAKNRSVRIGSKATPETKSKMRASATGKKHSREAIEKMKASRALRELGRRAMHGEAQWKLF